MRNVRLVGLDVMLIPNDFARRARSTHACSFALDMSTIDSEIVLSYPRHRAAQKDSSDHIITEEFRAYRPPIAELDECFALRRMQVPEDTRAKYRRWRWEISSRRTAPTNRSTASSELASFGTLVREPN